MTTSSVSPMTTELAGSRTGITLVTHAGAGSRGKHSTLGCVVQAELDPQRTLDAGYQLLESGTSAHEAVVVVIHVMEDAPKFNANRGTAPTSDGIAQMDARLMTGNGEVGAVTGVSAVKNPTDTTCAAKEQAKHVLFTDPTDVEITDRDVATESNEYFIIEQCRQSLAEAQPGGDEWEKHGTTDVVARNAEGSIAAGTSTGGTTNQMHGHVGDSPLSGCGTFANQPAVAASCTGTGEVFIKAAVVHQVSDRVRFSGESVKDAATATLGEVAAHHDDGGMIVLPAAGRGVVAYNNEMTNLGYRSVQEGKVQG